MSSSAEFGSAFPLPVTTLEYREIAAQLLNERFGVSLPGLRATGEEKRRAEVEMSNAELAERIRKERAEAVQELEQRLRQDYETKLQGARAAIAATVTAFDTQRAEYFGRAEAEIVQLALAIAAKILHREAQIDPMLVATLVRMSIDKMREGSSVTVRVSAGNAAKWRQFFSAQRSTIQVTVVEDATLTNQDCMLDTELGSANFGLDTQLKEVEQGFFDLMALRPTSR